MIAFQSILIFSFFFGFFSEANLCRQSFQQSFRGIKTKSQMQGALMTDKKLKRFLKTQAIDKKNIEGDTLLHVAIASKLPFSTIELLIAQGASPYILNDKKIRVIQSKYFSSFMNSILDNQKYKLNPNKKLYRAYYAGPEVFLSFHKEVADFIKVQAALFNKHQLQYENFQIKALFPTDTEAQKNYYSDEQQISQNEKDILFQQGIDIYKGNIDLMNQSHAILANTVIFRGSGMDSGTAFEVGYMNAQNAMIINYYDENAFYEHAQKNRLNIKKYEDIFGAFTKKGDRFYDEHNLEIELFNMSENLMIIAAGDVTSKSPPLANNTWEALEKLKEKIKKNEN